MGLSTKVEVGVASIVVYDANVIYPGSLRDLLVRLARAGLVEARWTNQILKEMVDAIVRRQPNLRTKLERTCSLMNSAVEDALVIDYEYLIPDINLPDPNDRHVLAAAIHSNAQTIITNNLKDFPQDILDIYEVKAQSADDFILSICEANFSRVEKIIMEQAYELRKPPSSLEEVLDRLDRVGIPESAKILRAHLGL